MVTGKVGSVGYIHAVGQDARGEYVGMLARIIAVHYGIHEDVILSTSRRQLPVLARQMIMAKCHGQGWTLEDVGAAFARDHSTVSHGIDHVERLMRSDLEVRMVYKGLPDFGDSTDHVTAATGAELQSALHAAAKAADELRGAVQSAERAMTAIAQFQSMQRDEALRTLEAVLSA